MGTCYFLLLRTWRPLRSHSCATRYVLLMSQMRSARHLSHNWIAALLTHWHQQAVESLNKICAQLSQQQVETYFIPLTIRLSKADWFTSKISATGLYNTPYQNATPQSQEGLRRQFELLVKDDTPMVRRQAANNLAKFVKSMPASIVVEDMMGMFQALSHDDQDSVRLLTVEVLIAIAEAVPKEQQTQNGVLLTALRDILQDKSWRVRYMAADRFEKIAKAVDEEVVQRDLVTAFVGMLKDNEAEVRSAVAGQIPGKCLDSAQCINLDPGNHTNPCLHRFLPADSSRNTPPRCPSSHRGPGIRLIAARSCRVR